LLTLREQYHPIGSGCTKAVEGEQERELPAEVDICSKVLLPQIEPLKSSPYQDVVTFVETARVPAGSAAFLSAFDALLRTSVADVLRSLQWPTGLLFVTADFTSAVGNLPSDAQSKALDAYQRPVQWDCTATITLEPAGRGDGDAIMAAVVLSLWEDNALMPVFRAGRTAAIFYLFAPYACLDTSLSRGLVAVRPAGLATWMIRSQSDGADAASVAGQLYLRTYNDYVAMCPLLGVQHYTDAEEAEEQEEEEEEEDAAVFGPDAIPFFLKLFEHIRHPEADISNTDIRCLLADDVLPAQQGRRPALSI